MKYRKSYSIHVCDANTRTLWWCGRKHGWLSGYMHHPGRSCNCKHLRTKRQVFLEAAKLVLAGHLNIKVFQLWGRRLYWDFAEMPTNIVRAWAKAVIEGRWK